MPERTEMESGCTFEGPHGGAKFGLVTVGERGQMVIPKDLREMLGIKTGDKLAVIATRKGGIGSCLIVFSAKVLSEKLKSFFGPSLEELLK